jgi:hypothetical protein
MWMDSHQIKESLITDLEAIDKPYCLKFLHSTMMDIDNIQALHQLADYAVASGQATLLQYDTPKMKR